MAEQLSGETCLVLDWSDLEEAPDRTGVYAWYYRPRISEADLGSAKDTQLALRHVLARLQNPSLRVEAHSHLSLSYSGELKHDTDRAGAPVAMTELVERSLETREGRELLAEVLRRGTVLLSAPIYIGVANSLLQRLRSHRRMMEELQADRRSSDSEGPGERALAREIVKRGIPLRDLVVAAVPLERERTENWDMSLRQRAESVETVLNRAFFPILGRR
jgi:hypothetical protein